MASESRGPGGRGRDMASPTRVSVVVALNHHERPEDHVRLLAAQTADPDTFEAVLVDGDARRDAGPAIEAARRAHRLRAPLRYLRAHGRRRPGLFNVGIAETRGDVLVLLASDGLEPPEFVERHAAFHAEHPDERDVALGPVLFDEAMRASPYRRWLEDSGRLFGVSF